MGGTSRKEARARGKINTVQKTPVQKPTTQPNPVKPHSLVKANTLPVAIIGYQQFKSLTLFLTSVYLPPPAINLILNFFITSGNTGSVMPSTARLMKATPSFINTNNTELPMDYNEVVVAFGDPIGGWITASSTKTGRSGWVPLNNIVALFPTTTLPPLILKPPEFQTSLINLILKTFRSIHSLGASHNGFNFDHHIKTISLLQTAFPFPLELTQLLTDTLIGLIRASFPCILLNSFKAMYDYTAYTDDELSFKEGQIIRVLEKDPSGWWKGELGGHIGWVPFNYVEEVPEVPQQHIDANQVCMLVNRMGRDVVSREH